MDLLGAPVAAPKANPIKAAPAKSGGGIFSKIIGGIGHVVTGLPGGLLQLGKDTGTVFVHGGENIINDVAGSHLGPASGWRSTPGHPGVVADQQEITQALNNLPSYRGIVQGVKQTGNEIVHPTQIARNYSQNPVGAFVNDVSNLLPLAKGAGAAARGAEAARLAQAPAQAAEAADAAGTASRASQAAQAVRQLAVGNGEPVANPGLLSKAGAAAQNASPAMGTAVRLLGGGANLAGETMAAPFRVSAVPAKFGTLGLGRVMAGKGGEVSDLLARHFSPEATKVGATNLAGNAETKTLASDDINLVRKAMSHLQGPAEKQAFWEIRQQTAPALSLLRTSYEATGAPERFGEAVAERSRSTLSPDAAHLAADVVEGKNPGAAERIAHANDILNAGIGKAGRAGLAAREEAFVSQPGHEWQAGYSPDQGTIDRALAPLHSQLSQAQDKADALRAKADLAWSRARGELETATGRLPAQTRLLSNKGVAAQASIQRAAGLFDRGQPSTLAARESAAGKQGLLTGAVDRTVQSGRGFGAARLAARTAEKSALDAEKRVSELTQRVEERRGFVANSVGAAPSRLRPALAEGRAATKSAVGVVNDLRSRGLDDAAARVEAAMAEVPTSLQHMEAKGFDAQYLPHVQPKLAERGVPAPKDAQSVARVFTPGSEKFRGGSPVYERSDRALAAGLVERDAAAVRRATAEKLASLPFMARLNEGPLAGVRSTKDALARNYVPFNPATIFDTQGNVRSLSELEAHLGITGDTVFMPKPLFDQFRNYFSKPSDLARGLRLITGPGNRAFVESRLSFSPSLITGRLIGHTVLQLARHTPAEMFSGLHQAYQAWANSAEGKGLLSELHKVGLGTSERTIEGIAPRVLKSSAPGTLEEQVNAGRSELAQTPFGRAVGKAAGPLRKLGSMNTTASNYTLHLASWWDNINRSAFYLKELERQHAAGNVGQEAQDAAVETALRAMGEFDKMNAFERDYVRQLAPFYTWTREITRIALHLAEDNPLRVAWTLHLADIAQQNQPPLSAYNQGDIAIGNTLLSPSFLVPFAETGTTFGGGYLGIGKHLGPVPRLALGQVTGVSPTTGKDFFMPPGTPNGPTGHPAAPSILSQIANLFPQTRLLQDLQGKDRIMRYADNEPVLPKSNGYRPLLTGSDLAQTLAGLAGVSLTNRQIAQSQEQKSLLSGAKKAQTGAKTLSRYRAHVKADERAGLLGG